MLLNWNITKEDAELIDAIVHRAEALLPVLFPPKKRRVLLMDITAVHLNGCPLDLRELLAADTFTFTHDVVGIYGHIDRDHGTLGDYFIPRCNAIRKENLWP